MDGAIFCAGGLGIFVIVFGFILAMRYLTFKETLALAEKGLVKPQRQRNGNGKNSLIWGIIITAVGLALTLGLWPLGFGFGSEYPLGFGPWMVIGLIPTFFGVALILIYVLTRGEKEEAPDKEEGLDVEK